MKIHRRCQCGCGKITNPGNKYINGHNMPMKGRKHSIKSKKQTSLALMNREFSKESRLKMSLSKIGNTNSLEYKHSNKTKKRMSLAQKGKIVSEEARENMSLGLMYNTNCLGRELSEEHKRKLSIAFSGSNHPNWQGGISCEPYCFGWTKELKDLIKERDNHECQNPDCWETTDILNVHHIDYVKKNCELDNLISLCISCNTRANTDKEYWENFYQEIVARNFI